MRNILYFLLLIVLVSSCMTKKEIVYLQNPNYKETIPTTHTTTYSAYKLQDNDVLSIKVLSVDPDMANMFNIVNPTNVFGMSDPGSMYLSGYTVDNEGNINLPIIGKLQVKGLTTTQTQDLVQRNLQRYVTDATVVTKLVSFKISILGDVRNPGHFYVYNDKINLFEGLAQAGDLNQGANRENVKLIRQIGDQTEVVLLDLKNPNLVQSQYYYLRPNDVIYVEPLKTQLKRENLVVVGVMLSVISTGVLLLNFLK